MPGLENLLAEVGLGSVNTGEDESNIEAKKALEQARRMVQQKTGNLALFGRYHAPPRKLADDYELTSTVIGQGLTGAVKLARSRCRPELKYAVKQIKLTDLEKSNLGLLEMEVRSYMCMDHPHIARLVDVYESDKFLTLVMECLTGGELIDRVQKRGGKPFAVEEAALIAHQVLLAVSYIHSLNVVHRDLKHSNILFDAPDSLFVKLIDFGMSKFAKSAQDATTSRGMMSWLPPVGHTDTGTTSRGMRRMRTVCGTGGYMAPEVRSGHGYSDKCDLWSVGVIIFHLLTGVMPTGAAIGTPSRLRSSSSMQTLGTKSESMASSPSQERASMSTSQDEAEPTWLLQYPAWKALPDEAKSFTRALLRVDPHERLSAKRALQHEWLLPLTEAGPEVDQSVVLSIQAFSKMSSTRKCFLSMVPWSLSSDEEAKVRAQFLALAEDERGTISVADLRPHLTRGTTEVFEKLDTSRDSQLMYSDFLSALVPTHIGCKDALLRASFRRFDVEGVGLIRPENIRSVLGPRFNGEPVEAILEEIGELEPGGISFNTFATCVSGGQPIRSVDEPARGVKCCAIS